MDLNEAIVTFQGLNLQVGYWTINTKKNGVKGMTISGNLLKYVPGDFFFNNRKPCII